MCVKAAAAPPPLWEVLLAFPICPLLLPHGQHSQGSNLPFLVLNFGVWRPVVSPFLPSSLLALFHCELLRVQLPGPVGRMAWPGAPLARLGTALWCRAALSQHRSHLARAGALPQAPPGHGSPVLPCPLPHIPGSLQMASPWVEETVNTAPSFLPTPWPQDHQPVPPERERLSLGLPEHHLSHLPNWSCSRLLEDFMKSGMCIFPSVSP